MKNFTIILICWIITTIIGAVVKINGWEYANYILGLSIILTIYGIYLLVTKSSRQK